MRGDAWCAVQGSPTTERFTSREAARSVACMKKPRAKSKRGAAKTTKLRKGRRLGGAKKWSDGAGRSAAPDAAPPYASRGKRAGAGAGRDDDARRGDAGSWREAERLDRSVIEVVRRAGGEPLSIGEIAEGLGFERHQAPELRIVVKRLIREGRLEASRGAGLRIPADGGARPRGRRSHGPPAEAGARAKAAGRGGRRGDEAESARGRGGRDERGARDERSPRDGRERRDDRGSHAGRGAARRIVEGRVSLNRRGFGFLVDSEGREEDLYLSPDELAGVLDGDEIRAEVREGREGRTMGRLLAILKRARRRVVGTVRRTPRGAEVIPDGATYRQRLALDEPRERRARAPVRRTRDTAPIEDLRDDEPIVGEMVDVPGRPQRESQRAADGEVVEVEIAEYPTRFRPGLARVLEILGEEGDPEVEVERIIRRFGLTAEFPEPVLAEARAIAETVSEEDVRGRRDLRAEPIVTIDGETARDFDDAVHVKQEANGVVRLTVSIADVAHYVRDGAALDAEARDRGTSVYFPSRVIPMLPERLSNGICSLNPGVDRLTLTAELTIDRNGRVLTTAFYESVIRSAARLTYTKVAAVLRGESVAEIEHLRPQILLMGEVMTRLHRARRGRGSIDFDLPEPEVIIDMTTGEPDAIVRSERNDAHRLIEEMMIAANEAVARWFVERKQPSIYRVHAAPDPKKLENFALVARAFGFTPPSTSGAAPLALANFVDAIEGKPAARALNTLLLRSMMRAEYSEANIGHFGLASRAYLHFTSPIRRYPDLIVHRLLKAHLAGQSSRLPGAQALGAIAKSSSAAERTADLAEYAVVDFWRARFMLDKVGEEFDGLVSGVAEFGVFVELIDFFVEGLVRIGEISGDFFILSDTGHTLVGRKSGLAFTIGDSVRVAVESVNLSEGRVELRLVRKLGKG